MNERRGDRAEDEEERALEQAADPARLHDDGGEHDRRRLDDHVAAHDVRDLVRDHALDLGRRRQTHERLGGHDRG